MNIMLIILLLHVGYLSANDQGKSSRCSRRASIVFLLPMSENRSSLTVYLEDFLLQLVNFFEISRYDFKISVLEYSNTIHLQSKFQTNRKLTNTEISSIGYKRIKPQLTGTFLKPALEKAYASIDTINPMEIYRKKIIVLFLNQNILDKQSSSDYANYTKDNGVLFYVVTSFKENLDIALSLASDTCKAFVVDDYKTGMDDIIADLGNNICLASDPKLAITSGPDILGNCNIDTVFKPPENDINYFCERDGLFPDLLNCAYFYKCTKGHSVHLKCETGSMFDERTQTCNHKNAVSCYTGVTCPDDTGLFPYPGDCFKFLNCYKGVFATVRKQAESMEVQDKDQQTLQWEDIVVLVGYFVAVIIVGILSSCRNRGSVKGYFLAGRSMHWIPVGASLFASNIGSGHFVGLAGSGAASGIGIAVFELNAIFILMVLGWIFVPVYTAAGVFTMPEYLRKRFGGQRIRVYLSVLALLLYVFTKLSADLFSGALFITLAFKDLNLYVAVIILLAIAAVFTVAGGLTAVIWTDFIQVVIMIIGAFIMTILSFIKVGGYEAMIQQYFEAYPDTTLKNYGNASYRYGKCGIPPDNAMHLFRSADDGSLPWPGIMFGLTISSVWYWCSDQVIVQRALAAKNLSNAKAGTIFAGYLKFLPLWIMVFPGMISRILFKNRVACGDPEKCFEICGSKAGCSNIAFPTLVLGIMPTGLRGLMLAVMMSALISSLTSIFNSSSTLFTIDIWLRIRKKASDVELMIVGRCCVLILVVVSIIWIPIIQNISELFHYIQAITSFLAPPVCAVYVLAVFWKRTNEKGAFWGLMVGLVVGLIRFGWEYAYTVPPCGEEEDDKRPAIISKVHYLHFGIILFGICFIVTVIISLLTKPIEDKHLHRLTFWNRFSTQIREDLDAEPDRQHQHQDTKLDHLADEDWDSLPCYSKAFKWICGIEHMEEEQQQTEEEKQAIEAKQNSIHETRRWRIILNVNAVILMTLAVFLWGFYA